MAMAYSHRYAEASKLFRDVIEKREQFRRARKPLVGVVRLRLCGSGCQPPR